LESIETLSPGNSKASHIKYSASRFSSSISIVRQRQRCTGSSSCASSIQHGIRTLILCHLCLQNSNRRHKMVMCVRLQGKHLTQRSSGVNTFSGRTAWLQTEMHRVFCEVRTEFIYVMWSEFLTTDAGVPGSIPGHYKKK
jgi:hypothetical protein